MRIEIQLENFFNSIGRNVTNVNFINLRQILFKYDGGVIHLSLNNNTSLTGNRFIDAYGLTSSNIVKLGSSKKFNYIELNSSVIQNFKNSGYKQNLISGLYSKDSFYPISSRVYLLQNFFNNNRLYDLNSFFGFNMKIDIISLHGNFDPLLVQGNFRINNSKFCKLSIYEYIENKKNVKDYLFKVGFNDLEIKDIEQHMDLKELNLNNLNDVINKNLLYSLDKNFINSLTSIDPDILYLKSEKLGLLEKFKELDKNYFLFYEKQYRSLIHYL